MRRYLSLLLIFSICLGDTLILKSKKVYNGELIKYVDDKSIMFRALPSASILININEVQQLTLTDGTKVFENGKILINNLNDTEKFKYAKRTARLKSFLGCTILILSVVILELHLEIEYSDSNKGGWVSGDNIDLGD